MNNNTPKTTSGKRSAQNISFVGLYLGEVFEHNFVKPNTTLFLSVKMKKRDWQYTVKSANYAPRADGCFALEVCYSESSRLGKKGGAK